jgi:hypothetical protein
MNLEELKTAWNGYNKKLAVSQRLNEQLIQSMLRERSRSRISKLRKENIFLLIYMVIVLGFLAAIFAGNPFDFNYTWQYIPYGMLAIGVIMAIFSLYKSLRNFDVDINTICLDDFLKKTIAAYEKNKKREQWFGIILLFAGALTVFSFLPKKLANKDLLPALGETAIMLLMTLLIYFIAFKLGAFRNRKKEGFENDLKELNELKAISSELNQDEKSINI